jgi:hypothetical protein
MATRAKSGEGLTVTILFDRESESKEEADALAMSQALAKQHHGRRRQVLIAMLAAMEQVRQRTGEIPTIVEISNAISEVGNKKKG